MLEQLLATLDVRVKAFALCETYPGWRLSFGPDEEPSLHYVLAGSGAIQIPDQIPIPLSLDTLVVLPKNTAHAFDGPDAGVREVRYYRPEAPQPGATVVPRICAGEGERPLCVVCGTIHAGFGGGAGFFDHLVLPLIESFANKPLRARFQALLEELGAPTLGTRSLVEAFLKQAIVLVLRRQMRATDGPLSWLKVGQDPRLAHAAAILLEITRGAITLEEVAARVGMSRATFAENFAAAFGKSPTEFVKQARLHHAARLLESTELPVKAIAVSIGYESRSHFSRVFRIAYGIDPTEYRKGATTRAIQRSPGNEAGPHEAALSVS